MTSRVSLWIPLLLVSISVVTGQTTNVAGSTTPPLPETTPARISTTAIPGSQQHYSQATDTSSMLTQTPHQLIAGLSSLDANGFINSQSARDASSDGFSVNHSTSAVNAPDASMQTNAVTRVDGAVSSGQINDKSANVILTISPTNVVSMYVSSAEVSSSHLSEENSTLKFITPIQTTSHENSPSVSTLIRVLDNDTAILLPSTASLDNVYSDSVQMLSDSKARLDSLDALASTTAMFESKTITSSVYSQTVLSRTVNISSNTIELLSIASSITDVVSSSVYAIKPTNAVLDSTVSFINSSISLPSLNTLKTPSLKSSFLYSIHASDGKSTSSDAIKTLSSLSVIPLNPYSTFTTMENSASLTHLPVSLIASYSDVTVTSNLRTEIISSDSIAVIISSVNISSSYSSSTVSTLISESLSTAVMPSTRSSFSSSDEAIVPDTDTMLNASSTQYLGSISLQTSTSSDSSSISKYLSGSVNTDEVLPTPSTAKFSYNLSETKSTLPISELPQNSLIITPTLSSFITLKSGDVSSMMQLSPSSVVVSDGLQSTSALLMNTSHIETETANVTQHTQSANLDTSFSVNIQKASITQVMPTIYSSSAVLSLSLPPVYSESFLLLSTFGSETSQYLSVSLIESALPPNTSVSDEVTSASGWSTISRTIKSDLVSSMDLVSASGVSSISEPAVTFSVLSSISTVISEEYSVVSLVSLQSSTSVNASAYKSVTMMASIQSTVISDISTQYFTLSTDMLSSILTEIPFSTTDFGSSTNHTLSVPLATIEPSISMILQNTSAIDSSTEIVSTEDLMFYTSSVFGKSEITLAITMSTGIETVSSPSQHASLTTNTISDNMLTSPRGVSPTSIYVSRITPHTSMHLDTSYSEIPDGRLTDLTYSTSPVLSTSQGSEFVAPVNSISANSDIVLSTILSSSPTPIIPQPSTEVNIFTSSMLNSSPGTISEDLLNTSSTKHDTILQSIYSTVVQETLNTSSSVSPYTDFVSQSSYDVSGLSTPKLSTKFTSSIIVDSVDTLSSSTTYDAVSTPSFKVLSMVSLETQSSIFLDSQLSYLYSTRMQYSSTRVVSEEILSSHTVHETIYSPTTSSITESEFIPSLTVITSTSRVTSAPEVPSSMLSSVDDLLSVTATETIYQTSATIIDSSFTANEPTNSRATPSETLDISSSASLYMQTSAFTSSVVSPTASVFTPGSTSLEPSSLLDIATVITTDSSLISELASTNVILDSPVISARTLSVFSIVFASPTSDLISTSESLTPVLTDSIYRISSSLISTLSRSQEMSGTISGTELFSTTYGKSSVSSISPTDIASVSFVTSASKDTDEYLSLFSTVLLPSPTSSSTHLSVLHTKIDTSSLYVSVESHSISVLESDSKMTTLFTVSSTPSLLSTTVLDNESTSPTEIAGTSSVSFVASAGKSEDTAEYLSSFSTVNLPSLTFSSTQLSVLHTELETRSLSVESLSISVLESESKMTTSFTVFSTPLLHSTTVLDSESTSLSTVVSQLTSPSVLVLESYSLSTTIFTPTLLSTSAYISTLVSTPKFHSTSVLDVGPFSSTVSTPMSISRSVLDSEIVSAVFSSPTPISTSVLTSGSASSFPDVSSLAPSSTTVTVVDSETTTSSSRFVSTFTPPLSSRQSVLSPVDSTIDVSSKVSTLDTTVVLPTSEVFFSEANLTSTSMDTGNMTVVVPTKPLETVSMSISVSVSGNVTVASTLISATATVVVTSSSMHPTTQKPPDGTTLNATNAEEPYWCRTVMKIRRTVDVTLSFFKADLERRLAMAFNEAFIRQTLIQQGRFEFLKRRRRKKRFTTVEDASVHVREVSRDGDTSSVSAVYSVERSGQVLTATDAVTALNSLDTQEVAILLQQVLETKAEPFLTVDKVDEEDEDSKIWLIAAIVGPIVAFLIFVWVMLCIYFKCSRSKHRRGSAAEPQLMSIEQTPEKHQKAHLSNVTEGPSRQDKMGSRGTLGSKVRAYEVAPTPEVEIIQPDRTANSPPTLAKTIQNGTILKDTPLSSPKTSLAPPKPKRARKTRRNSVEPLSQEHMPASVQTSPSASHTQVAPPLGHLDDTRQLLQSSISDDNEDLQQRARIERRRNKDRLREKRMKERGEDRRVADFVTSQNHLNALGLASTSLPSVHVER